MSMCNNQRYQKSSVQTYNNVSQVLTTNSNLNLGSVSVDTGCSISNASGSTSIKLRNPGLYLIMLDAVAVNSSGTAGDVTVQMQKNGVNLPDAFSTATSSSATDEVALSFSKLVQVSQSCCAVDNSALITFINTGALATYSHVNVTAIKLA